MFKKSTVYFLQTIEIMLTKKAEISLSESFKIYFLSSKYRSVLTVVKYYHSSKRMEAEI